MSCDPWMAILEQRNATDELASPNEKLNSRRTRTVIPVKSELLEPHVIPTSSIIRASVKKKQQNKRYHDKRAKLLPPLVVGDGIHAKIRPQSSPLWTQGRVVRRESDRSYIVKADGREYRRNRCHIIHGCLLMQWLITFLLLAHSTILKMQNLITKRTANFNGQVM